MTPSICCICLTADRQAFTTRAVNCFEGQTYKSSWLLIYDTGKEPFQIGEGLHPRVAVVYDPTARGRSIGHLRNKAIDLAGTADLIAHWDSDDWSAPERLERQAAAIGGNDITGCHNLLFADTRNGTVHAWEYDYYRYGVRQAVGTSLMYTRLAWEQREFEDVHPGEDARFQRAGGRSLTLMNGVRPDATTGPLLIAEVHGGNTSGVGPSGLDRYMAAHNPEWRPAPEYDQICLNALYPKGTK